MEEIIKLITWNFEKEREEIVEICNPQLKFEVVEVFEESEKKEVEKLEKELGQKVEKVEVWIEGSCCRCEKKLSMYVLHSGQICYEEIFLEMEKVKCDCGTFDWQGEFADEESEKVFDSLLENAGIKKIKLSFYTQEKEEIFYYFYVRPAVNEKN